MTKPHITLFVDIVSPFAYMGFYALQNFPIFKQCEITYVPIFLGGLMKTCGNTAPMQIKNKDRWIDVERLRWSRLFNIPMSAKMPEGFPPLTLNLQRTLTAVHLSSPQQIPAALDALYKALWVESQPISEPTTFETVLASIIGDNAAKEAVEKGQSGEVKAALIANTDLAFKEGAFGLPWFVATNAKGEKEGFWGFDHLGQVADHLGLERPTTGGWKALL